LPPLLGKGADVGPDELADHIGHEPAVHRALLTDDEGRYWYWIDDDDLITKRALTAVIYFFTLAETGGNDKLPLITIPAQ
jgi:hypothetical protein